MVLSHFCTNQSSSCNNLYLQTCLHLILHWIIVSAPCWIQNTSYNKLWHVFVRILLCYIRSIGSWHTNRWQERSKLEKTPQRAYHAEKENHSTDGWQQASLPMVYKSSPPEPVLAMSVCDPKLSYSVPSGCSTLCTWWLRCRPSYLHWSPEPK